MSGFITHTARVGSFDTRYLEAGKPGSPVLVLLHDGGFGATAELCWSALITELADEFHIFAPDLLGWGGTDKAVFLDRSPYAARLPHLADFAALAGFDRAVYVGSSFGGSLTLRASVEAGNPLRLAGGISISGTGGPYRKPEGITALSEFTPSLEAARDLTRMIIGHLDGMEEHARGRFAASMIPGHWECMAAPRLRNPSAEPRQPAADGYLEKLAASDIPLLLIEGLQDPLLETGWAEKMAALSPHIESVALEAGHQPNIDQPQLIAELIRGFIRKTGLGQ